MSGEEILISFGGAALAGAIYGICAYFKNKNQKDYLKEFSYTTFVVSVLGSAIIGSMAAYSGVTPDIMATSATGALVFQALNKVFKGLLPS